MGSKSGRNMKRFSDAEDQTIAHHIKTNPTNLTNGFILAAKELGRSPKSVAGRYYTRIRNRKPLLATGNDQVLVINTKNTLEGIYNSHFNAIMRDNLIKQVFNSMPQDVLVEFFMDNISKEEKNKLCNKVLKQLKH